MSKETKPFEALQNRVAQIETTISHVNAIVLDRAIGIFETPPIDPSMPLSEKAGHIADISKQRQSFVKGLIEVSLPQLYEFKAEADAKRNEALDEIIPAAQTLIKWGVIGPEAVRRLSNDTKPSVSSNRLVDKKALQADTPVFLVESPSDESVDEQVAHKEIVTAELQIPGYEEASKTENTTQPLSPRLRKALEIVQDGQEFTVESLAHAYHEEALSNGTTTLEKACNHITTNIIPRLTRAITEGSFTKRRIGRKMYYRYSIDNTPEPNTPVPALEQKKVREAYSNTFFRIDSGQLPHPANIGKPDSKATKHYEFIYNTLQEGKIPSIKEEAEAVFGSSNTRSQSIISAMRANLRKKIAKIVVEERNQTLQGDPVSNAAVEGTENQNQKKMETVIGDTHEAEVVVLSKTIQASENILHHRGRKTSPEVIEFNQQIEEFARTNGLSLQNDRAKIVNFAASTYPNLTQTALNMRVDRLRQAKRRKESGENGIPAVTEDENGMSSKKTDAPNDDLSESNNTDMQKVATSFITQRLETPADATLHTESEEELLKESIFAELMPSSATKQEATYPQDTIILHRRSLEIEYRGKRVKPAFEGEWRILEFFAGNNGFSADLDTLARTQRDKKGRRAQELAEKNFLNFIGRYEEDARNPEVFIMTGGRYNKRFSINTDIIITD